MVGKIGSPKAARDGEEVEGLPWWWEYFWKLPFTKRGQPGESLTLGDTMHVFRTNIEQIYGGFPSVDGAVVTVAQSVFSASKIGDMSRLMFNFFQAIMSRHDMTF